MSSSIIGIIAEDRTDCDAIRKIVQRVLGTNIGTKLWASKGCSTLKRKLSAKLDVLSREGCNAFIIIHDLDRNPQNNSLNDEGTLRKKLEDASSAIKNTKKHICIPIEELEAWFWADPEVIKYVGRGKGEASNNPHLIVKPKEQLIKLSGDEKRKPRYSTNMNVELAERLDLQLCSQRCVSFEKFLDFLHSL
ncbi:DUF4276 family protein [Oscillatoria sp. FACHB-1406]|uniref:DUF4276 family protein n=1 Tax=Oscillatoria sp. FACHB-1406 TaxID=2692846 RepID=UPI00168849E9|nr:DUF4276 family protein [Oscillatoria sp. FACHB-1406]MBD2577979.1 DUF4276 family protein [Oscillatoria sp. FACHB-1406]